MLMRRLATVLLLALIGTWLTPAVVTGATDTTPPVWTKLPTASIPVGAALDPWDCNGDEELILGPVYVDYKAQDPQSGISHYEVDTYDWDEENNVGLATRYTTYSQSTDPADCWGGGRQHKYFQAFNGAGLMSTTVGWSPFRLGVIQDAGSSLVTYSGAWTSSSCACWSGGTVRKTTQAGASVQLRLNNSTDRAVGIVMSRGPDRGVAAVLLDGVRVATVDTRSATKINRTVVWRGTVSSGSHTLRVANLATAGRARIDVDAFVLLDKQQL